MLDDDRLAGFFEGVDMRRQRAHQTQFLSAVAGGPVEYTGTDMESAHDHLEIGSRDFALIARYLDRTLAEFGIGAEDREAVLNAFYAYEDAIVTAP